MVISLERGADLHIVQMMPLPLTVSFQWTPDWLTFLVPAHGPLNMHVCVCVMQLTVAWNLVSLSWTANPGSLSRHDLKQLSACYSISVLLLALCVHSTYQNTIPSPSFSWHLPGRDANPWDHSDPGSCLTEDFPMYSLLKIARHAKITLLIIKFSRSIN